MQFELDASDYLTKDAKKEIKEAIQKEFETFLKSKSFKLKVKKAVEEYGEFALDNIFDDGCLDELLYKYVKDMLKAKLK